MHSFITPNSESVAAANAEMACCAVAGLEQCLLFSHLPASRLAALAANATVHRLQPDETLFERGASSWRSYLVVVSKLALVLPGSGGAEKMIEPTESLRNNQILLRTQPIPDWRRCETGKIRLHSSLCVRIFPISRLASRVWLRSHDEFDYFSGSEAGGSFGLIPLSVDALFLIGSRAIAECLLHVPLEAITAQLSRDPLFVRKLLADYLLSLPHAVESGIVRLPIRNGFSP